MYLKLRKYCDLGEPKVLSTCVASRRIESNRIESGRLEIRQSEPKSQSKGCSADVSGTLIIEQRKDRYLAGVGIHTTVCRSVCPAVNECGSRTSNDTPPSNLHALYAE